MLVKEWMDCSTTSCQQRERVDQAQDQHDHPDQLFDATGDRDEQLDRVEQKPDAAANANDADCEPEDRDGEADHGGLPFSFCA